MSLPGSRWGGSELFLALGSPESLGDKEGEGREAVGEAGESIGSTGPASA